MSGRRGCGGIVIAAVAMFIWVRKPKPAVVPAPATVEQPAAARPAGEAKEKAGEDEEIRVRVTPPPTP